MKTLQILSLIALSIFLVSTASALMVVNAQWEDGGQSVEIKEGESAGFDVYFVTYDYPMNVEVILYDSNDNVEKVFISDSTEDYFFEHFYTINENIYDKAGTYKVVISGSDDDGGSDSVTLTLKIVSDDEDDNDDEDDEDDNDNDKKARHYEDDLDREAYLKQFESKTIVLDDDKTQDSKSSKSWIIWTIVGLILLVVLVIVLMSLRR